MSALSDRQMLGLTLAFPIAPTPDFLSEIRAQSPVEAPCLLVDQGFDHDSPLAKG